MAVQVLLIVADPGDVAAGAEQDARDVRRRGGIGEVIDPVRPAAGVRRSVRSSSRPRPRCSRP
ncbi:hypothetical protein HD597_012401 [Nonomuraea thailandensis]|uniref:Uncharacterized protein n=1 Tax=Nonomuraea thailandensis TaxID=1188745 RepID=A0A9X2KCT4_9ACTN|nr:hypothetical protein [Nonomuraea thailandensis]MCP2365381.1 hypothetical protein [Nonomuraea thailandensis]